MLKIIVLVILASFVCHIESFFISSKDIRKIFGFGPSSLIRTFQRDVENEDESDGSNQHTRYRNYPKNINEKLNSYSKRRPEFLDNEDSKQYDNIEEKEDGSEILKVKVVKDGTYHNKDRKVLLIVPEDGYKYLQMDETEFHHGFMKYFDDYTYPNHEDFIQ